MTKDIRLSLKVKTPFESGFLVTKEPMWALLSEKDPEVLELLVSEQYVKTALLSGLLSATKFRRIT